MAKRLLVIVAVMAFAGLVLTPVFSTAQAQNWQWDQMQAQKLASAKTGTFKGEVVSCDPKANSCKFKGAKGNEKTGSMMYASYNGGFNAAKELQAGDKVIGKWAEVDGKGYVTMVVKP